MVWWEAASSSQGPFSSGYLNTLGKSLKISFNLAPLGSLEKDVLWSGCWGKYYGVYIRLLLWSYLLWTVKFHLTTCYGESHNLCFFTILLFLPLKVHNHDYIVLYLKTWLDNKSPCRKCMLYLSDFTFQILSLSQQNWWAF